MHLEWLEDILAIARTGSFSAAAEQRRLTQSAFSRRVKQIEDHVGVELFDRSRKPVVLRATTQAQREQIDQLVGALRQLEIDLRRGDRIANDKIVIASQHSLTTSFAPSVVAGIQRRGGAPYLRLRSANLDECFGLLLSRQADVAIYYVHPEDKTDSSAGYFDTITIGRDRLIPVCARAHDGQSAAGKAEMPYVAYPRDVFFGRVMEKAILPALSATRTPVPTVETALTLAALEMASIGVATAWVPESLARASIKSGRLTDLSGALPSSELSVQAARLHGATGHVELAFWSHLQSQRMQKHPA